ncbi:MAG: hypothetical protein ACLFU5_08895 [Thermoplasmata archaeon]
MTEEGKVRLMVIPIVAMLAVTMIVAGWQQEEPIEVEEGYGEMSIEYFNKTDNNMGREFSSKNATAVTNVNGENNTLELEVTPLTIWAASGRQSIRFKIEVKNDFEQNFNPKKLLLTAKGPDEESNYENTLHFSRSYSNVSGLVPWPGERCEIGKRGNETAFIGYDIKENHFSVKTRTIWDIPKGNWNNTYTLTFQSLIKGMSEDVKATIDVNIKEEVKV